MESTQSTQAFQSFPSYVTYDKFNRKNLTYLAPENKSAEVNGSNGSKEKINYSIIGLMYNYGNDESKSVNTVKYEGCEMTSYSGISEKMNQQGRMEYTVQATVDITRPEGMLFADKTTEFYEAAMEIMLKEKGNVKKPTFSKVIAPELGFKNPLYFPTDPATGERLPGRNPSMFAKLIKYGTGASEMKTLFTGLDGKPIPWELLKNVQMRFIPLFHMRRIYVASKVSIQFNMVSAIVTDIKPAGSESAQTPTLERLLKLDPNGQSKFEAQLAKLTAQRSSILLPLVQGSEEGSDKPTFEGLESTTQQSNSSVPALPVVAAPAPHAPTMQDIVSSAPVRPVEQPSTVNLQTLPTLPVLQLGQTPGLNLTPQIPHFN